MDALPKTYDETLAAWHAAEPCQREACMLQLYTFAASIYALAGNATDLKLHELAKRHRAHADVFVLAAQLLDRLGPL